MRRLKAPSPAMVVALIALFVALGGTGYAARNVISSASPSTGPLPSGKSESGLFAGGGGDSTGDWIGVSVNFPRPLKTPIKSGHVVEVTGTSGPHCPGAGHAARGYLCFYNTIESGVSPLTDIYSNSSYILGKLGVVVYWEVSSNAASPYVGGSWTVTAP